MFQRALVEIIKQYCLLLFLFGISIKDVNRNHSKETTSLCGDTYKEELYNIKLKVMTKNPSSTARKLCGRPSTGDVKLSMRISGM